MKIELVVKNTENLGPITEQDIRNFEEIFSALVSSGGLTGVKGGKTIIHFDAEGLFQKIQLDYYPWNRRRI